LIRDRLSSFVLRSSEFPWAFCHTNRRFEFHKLSQLFISVHNVTLPIAAMRVNNPNRSPLCIVATFGLPKASAACQRIGSRTGIVLSILGFLLCCFAALQRG
jgi:hypothetical protein